MHNRFRSPLPARHARRKGGTVLTLFAALAAMASPLACGTGSRSGEFQQKLVVLGFDGLDPDLVREWVDEGKLPNIARLVKQGGLYPLETTVSPESPTAWASFA